jgi:catechol 2,3-dioxygenase-like lactoylglutathione lyase family enzyme
MRVEGVTPILNVSNVEASLTWFGNLGWETRWTNAGGGVIAGFAAISSGRVEIFLCRDGQGSRGGAPPRHPADEDTGGVWMTWWVASPAEVDAAHALAAELGYEISWPPTDEPWGVREFHLRHPDGHTFRVGCGLGCDAGVGDAGQPSPR